MTPISLVSLLVPLLVVVALVVARLRNLLATTVVFAAYSLGMAIVWVVLQAPDVALTEAAVGAGVTTSLFLVVVAKIGWGDEGESAERERRPVPMLASLGVAGALLLTVPSLPRVGAADAPAFQRVAPYYLEQSVPELGIQNVVTAVLAGYRAFDTFGEVTVVFAAGVAVLVVFRKEVL